MKCYSCTIAKGGEVFMTDECIARQHAGMPEVDRDVRRYRDIDRWDAEGRHTFGAKGRPRINASARRGKH